MSNAETRAAEVLAEHEPVIGAVYSAATGPRGMIVGCSCLSAREYAAAGHKAGVAGHRAHVAAALSAAGCLRDDRACRWCPPGCESCEPDDCECYTHQDCPDCALRDNREEVGRAYSYAQGRARACYARGDREREREWLDLLHLLDAEARDDREGETVTAERAWSDALDAVAWCLDNGESSVAAALAYVAKNNPHATPVTPDGGDQR